jgi:hypothetical protein
MRTFFAIPSKTIVLSLMKVQMFLPNAAQASFVVMFANTTCGWDVVLFPYLFFL